MFLYSLSPDIYHSLLFRTVQYVYIFYVLMFMSKKEPTWGCQTIDHS